MGANKLFSELNFNWKINFRPPRGLVPANEQPVPNTSHLSDVRADSEKTRPRADAKQGPIPAPRTNYRVQLYSGAAEHLAVLRVRNERMVPRVQLQVPASRLLQRGNGA